MMLQYRKTRVILISIIVIAFFLLISKHLPLTENRIVIPRKYAVDTSVFKVSEFMSEVAQVSKCPVCFGQDLCPELSRKDYEISRDLYSADRTLPGIYQVYQGKNMKYWIKPLASWPISEHGTTDFENFVCLNATSSLGYVQKGSCEVAMAAQNSFLMTLEFNERSLRNLHKALFLSRRRMPVSTCPTWKLIEGFIRSFDLDHDQTLTGHEKATLFSTLAGWPDVAVNRFIRANSIRIPQLNFYGSCGRASVIEGAFRPLSSFMDQSLEVRKGLAIQILQLFETFINEDPNWILFTTDISAKNLVVTNAGDVAMLDMSQVMIIDRELAEGMDEDTSSTKECDFNCLATFYDNLLESEDTKMCFKLKEHVEYMFALVCKNVLSDMESEREERLNDQRGLLHSFQNEEEMTEVNNLIRECIDETDKGGRLSAAMNLVELFRADFGEDEDDDDDDSEDGEVMTNEEDYDEGNVAHVRNLGGLRKNPEEVEDEGEEVDEDVEKDPNKTPNKILMKNQQQNVNYDTHVGNMNMKKDQEEINQMLHGHKKSDKPKPVVEINEQNGKVLPPPPGIELEKSS